MPRTPDLARKPALLAEIVDHLLDKPLATLSFRRLATGLGISTYSLVYHFGTRAQLLRDIIEAISERQEVVMPIIAAEDGDLEVHIANIRRSWALGLEPRSRQLLRLEFEAAMLESHESLTESSTARVFDRWYLAGVDALVAMGLSRAEADLEARIVVDTIYGLQYDLIVARDTERATAAFERVLESYEARIRALRAAAKS